MQIFSSWLFFTPKPRKLRNWSGKSVKIPCGTMPEECSISATYDIDLPVMQTG
jgi:hypothetical protein